MAENNEIASVAEVLKLQQDLRARFEARLDKEGVPRLKKPEELLELRGEDLANAKAALTEAEGQRDAIGKYWNDRVARLRARVDRQSNEIEAAKEAPKASSPKVKPVRKK